MKMMNAASRLHDCTEEHKEFFTGLITLIVSVSLSFITGTYLGSVADILVLIPGLMVIVTPSINMRGAIAGILTSRLSSSMHLGAFDVKLGKNTELGDNLRASIILIVIVSTVLAVFGKIICLITGTQVIGIIEMIIISVISGTIAGFIVVMLGILISLICYRKRFNLDMVGAPVVTTIGDMITLPCIVVTAVIIMELPKIWEIIFGIIVVALMIWAIFSMKNCTRTVKDVLKEGVPLLIPLSLIGVIAGVFYTVRLDELITFAAVLILTSPFMNGCGSIGGILTSRIGTEMHMGLVDPNIIPQKIVMMHFLQNYLFGAIILTLMGFFSHYSAVIFGIATPGLLPMLILSLSSGAIVITIMNLLGYYTTVAAYRKGFDPDNFGVPVVTSSIDLIGATVILIMMSILFV